MPDHPIPDPGAVGAMWRNQPAEGVAFRPQDAMVQARTADLTSVTRSEIVNCLGAAIFFIAVLAWRLRSFSDPFLAFGCLLVAVWILLTIYRVRGDLWGPRTATASVQDLAATGIAYYRGVLEMRRKHLASSWLWHGPLVLACVLTAAVVIRTVVPSMQRLLSVLPLLLVLAGWIVIGIRRRRRQIRSIEREIEEVTGLAAQAS